MSDYQNKPENEPNSGALFKNTYKVEGDSTPDWSGPWVNERGDEMRIGFWFRTSKAGNPYIYAKVDEKTEVQQQQQQQQQQQPQFQTHQQAPTPPPMPDDFFEDDVKAQVLGDTGRF